MNSSFLYQLLVLVRVSVPDSVESGVPDSISADWKL